MKVTAIFDIGKTNKKFFLFDERYQEVYRSYTRFEESVDEDGFACENLEKLSTWMLDTFSTALAMPEFKIQHLNFSTYGASLVHLDEQGQAVTPLYNYLKPFPKDLLADFFEKYGPEGDWSAQTATPVMGMLNSGLQLYWLKYRQPETFSRIRQSLHLPQYCAYLFSKTAYSEFTSIGCHTGMWDFEENRYHRWIYEEGLDALFPPIQPTTFTVDSIIEGKKINVGVGIHDSSAALVPYILANPEPFLLISTGTWSITLNPYSQQLLNQHDLQMDCLNFLRVDGNPVRAARLFLGNEYKIWAKKLAAHFQISYESHRKVEYQPELFKQLERFSEPVYQWESITRPQEDKMLLAATDLSVFSTYEEAYHQLIKELTDLQLSSVMLAKGDTDTQKIYLDGGFVDNKLFTRLMAEYLEDFELIVTEAPLGSALGAAMAVQNQAVDRELILKKFTLQ